MIECKADIETGKSLYKRASTLPRPFGTTT